LMTELKVKIGGIPSLEKVSGDMKN
jgi:hypothetical protein